MQSLGTDLSMKPKRASTLSDVGRLAGVSAGTVSRALAGNPRVSEATRARVLQAAEALHYAPNLAAWKNLRPCEPGEPPDVIVRQAPAPQSVFRAAVRTGMAASDVLQVWVDVAAHPSRGREQADLIRRRVLHRVIDGNP